MKFFDCNASFGAPMLKPLRYAENAGELLSEMDYYGISEALVYHVRQRDDSPVVGDRMLLQEIKGFPEAAWDFNCSSSSNGRTGFYGGDS